MDEREVEAVAKAIARKRFGYGEPGRLTWDEDHVGAHLWRELHEAARAAIAALDELRQQRGYRLVKVRRVRSVAEWDDEDGLVYRMVPDEDAAE